MHELFILYGNPANSFNRELKNGSMLWGGVCIVYWNYVCCYVTVKLGDKNGKTGVLC